MSINKHHYRAICDYGTIVLAGVIPYDASSCFDQRSSTDFQYIEGDIMQLSRRIVGQVTLIAVIAFGAILGSWVVGITASTTAVSATTALAIGGFYWYLKYQPKQQTRPVPIRADLPTIPSRQPTPYQPPAIIYEGDITTRAGSPTGLDPNGIDPADLFDH